MKYSAFSRYGQLRFSGRQPTAKRIYDSIVAMVTDPKTGTPVYDLTVGTHEEAKIFAMAMRIAAAQVNVERAGRELRGSTSYAMLPFHEKRYEIAPDPSDTITMRRKTLAAREKLLRGARYEAMIDGLQGILGDNLIAYRRMDESEVTTWPSDTPAGIAAGPGVFSRADLPDRTVRSIGPICGIGPFTLEVPYENWDPKQPEIQLVKGETVCVQPENMGLAEKVVVSATSGTGASRAFTATFARGHDEGCSITPGPAPLWFSTRRIVFIVVKHAAAIDVRTRRRINEFMARSVKSVTTWAIVEPSSPGASTMGPFTLNVSPLGCVPIGLMTI